MQSCVQRAVLALVSLMLLAAGEAVEIQASPEGRDDLRERVAPAGGVSLKVEWGDLPQRLVKLGVVNVTMLNETMVRDYGRSLSREELTLFEDDSLGEVMVDSESKVILQYIFWSLGASNSNPILQRSPFADTFKGYGNLSVITLTPEQQRVVEEVASNSYRPCCDSPTSFPDCSHGFAALGLAEFLAYNGLSKRDVYRGLLLFNSYWFTDEYTDLAVYFEDQDVDWRGVDAETVLGPQYSSMSGYREVKKYIEGAVTPPVRFEPYMLLILTATLFVLLLVAIVIVIRGRTRILEEVGGAAGGTAL